MFLSPQSGIIYFRIHQRLKPNAKSVNKDMYICIYVCTVFGTLHKSYKITKYVDRPGFKIGSKND